MKLVRKSTLIVLGLALLFGCDSSAPPRALPTPSHTELRAAPDFTPKPGDIPVPGEFPSTDSAFRIHASSSGELFRDGKAVPLPSIIKELLDLPDVENTTILIEGDSDVRMSVLLKLQSDLSDAIPNLGSVIFGVSEVSERG